MQNDLHNIFEQAKNQKPLIPLNEENIKKAMANAKGRKQARIRFNKEGLPKHIISIPKILFIMTGIALIISLITFFAPTNDGAQISKEQNLQIIETVDNNHEPLQVKYEEPKNQTLAKDKIFQKASKVIPEMEELEIEEIPIINKIDEKIENRFAINTSDILTTYKYGSIRIDNLQLSDSIINLLPILTKSQLYKLGFRFFKNGEIYFNKNNTGTFTYFATKPIYSYGHSKNYPYTRIANPPTPTLNEFYPVFFSDVTNRIITQPPQSHETYINKMLAPVIIPKSIIKIGNNNLIAWFDPTDTFWDIINSTDTIFDKSNIIQEEIRKDESQHENLENYTAKIMKIELDKNGLKKLGFHEQRTSDSTLWTFHSKQYSHYDLIYHNSKISKGTSARSGGHRGEKSFSADGSYIFNAYTVNNSLKELYSYLDYKNLRESDLTISPKYVYTLSGYIMYTKEEFSELYQTFYSDSIISNVNNLVPVFYTRKTLGLKNSKEGFIFWFEPTEELFQRLPDSIANELRKEYQVNVLKLEETKGETVSCKYFQSYCTPIPGIGEINLYPNPANNAINANIPFTEDTKLKIQVVDLSGKQAGIQKSVELLGEGERDIPIDISKLNQGMYLMIFTNADGISHSLRFIKR